MCGFFYALSIDQYIPHDLCRSIVDSFILQRGPDSCSEFYSGHEYIFQSTLAVQSNAYTNSSLTSLGSPSFCLYNGEIFDPSIPTNTSDTSTVWEAFDNGRIEEYLKSKDGMYAIAFVTNLLSSSNDEFDYPLRILLFTVILSGKSMSTTIGAQLCFSFLRSRISCRICFEI